MISSTQTSESMLPDGFADLERFASWILPTEIGRNAKRLSSNYAEVKDFYDTMTARSDVWTEYLNRFTLSSMSPADERLYHLALSLMEVALAVEYFQSSDLTGAVPADRVNILSPSYRGPQW